MLYFYLTTFTVPFTYFCYRESLYNTIKKLNKRTKKVFHKNKSSWFTGPWSLVLGLIQTGFLPGWDQSRSVWIPRSLMVFA